MSPNNLLASIRPINPAAFGPVKQQMPPEGMPQSPPQGMPQGQMNHKECHSKMLKVKK